MSILTKFLNWVYGTTPSASANKAPSVTVATAKPKKATAKKTKAAGKKTKR